MIIAAYQGPSPEGDLSYAFSKIDEILAKAAKQGAQMVVFPELYLLGYNQMHRHAELAQPIGDDWEIQCASLTQKHKCGLTIGWAERSSEALFNSASTFDANGAKLGHYRKIQLWGPTEQSVFAFGDSYTSFALNGVKTAILICYDVEFAQHCRALADMGVKRILVPTANPADFSLVCNTLIPARATENNQTIVYANYCGADNGLSFCGQSIIAGPAKTILTQASRDGEILLVADLNEIDKIEPSLLSTQLADYRKVSS
ncbi:MAG: carbon-nitrogen hydrolase family protein [Amylibacter sp.]